MKIDFKQPKYVLPVIMLPFICFFFYLWRTEFSKPQPIAVKQDGLNPTVARVSGEVQSRQMADKLDAFRDTYKDAYGTSAVNVIPAESSSNPGLNDPYAQRRQDQRLLDSLSQMAVKRFQHHSKTENADVERAVETLTPDKHFASQASSKAITPEPDPMQLFKQQMAYIDSVSRENDPEIKAERSQKEAARKLAEKLAEAPKLPVTKAQGPSTSFQTIMPQRSDAFISAVIDENMTGYGGSRLRLRLLEDIKAGGKTVKKGSPLYAMVSGFSEQRVMLSVTSIMSGDKIMPVQLQLYDLDGLPGLYVPASAFRDFTKDLGGNTVQGVSVGGASANNQFVMSTVDKVFQSTSSAIASLLRKNKARLKYNTYIYLIDPEALHNP